MIRSFFVSRIIALALIQFSTSAFADAFPFEKQIIRNVVKIEAYGGCGTGFVLDGGLMVTNAHVVQGACTQEKCERLKIYRAKNLGEKPELYKELELKIRANFPATDLVILESKEDLGSQGIQGKVDVPLSKEKLISYGFPHCEKLEKFEGAAQDINRQEYKLGFEGVRGQSGSPIFNQKGNIIGILTRGSDDDDENRPSELYASRVDRYFSDLTKVRVDHIEVELLDQYEDFFGSISSAPSKFSLYKSLGQHPFRQSEIQFGLSGQCPELKDFFLWKSNNFRSHIPIPNINVESLNPSCGLIFKYAIKAGVFSEMMTAVNILILETIPIDQYSAIASVETFKARDDWQKSLNAKPWLSSKELNYLLLFINGILVLSGLVFFVFRKYKTPRKLFKTFLLTLIGVTLIQTFFV